MTTITAVKPSAATQPKLHHPEHPEITVQFEYIDAELASLYLTALEETQRPRSNAKIKQYIGDMVAGRWPFNGDTMCFDQNEDVIDGQHRLYAIKASGTPQWVLVVRGLGKGIIDVKDIGLPRTFKTWLRRIVKPTNVQSVGTITGMLWHWEHGNYGYRDIGRIPYSEYKGFTPSTPELQQQYRAATAEIAYAASEGHTLHRKLPVKSASAAVLGFAVLILRRIDVFKANEFFSLLTDPRKRVSDENRPIFILYEQMDRASHKGNTGREGWKWLHYIFTAWNLWISKTSLPKKSTSYTSPSKPGPGNVAVPTSPSDHEAINPISLEEDEVDGVKENA